MNTDKRIGILFRYCAALLTLVPAALARAGDAAPTPGSAANLWQVMAGLLVVLVVIFVLAWLLRRFGQGGLLANPHMKVLGSLPLGTRERVVMIEVGGQQVLVGVAPGRVSKLHVFPTPVIDIPPHKETSEFAHKIREIMNRGGGR